MDVNQGESENYKSSRIRTKIPINAVTLEITNDSLSN